MSETNRSRSVALYYATHDGQSRRIAEHISRRLAACEITTLPLDIAATPPTPADLAAASVVVLVAAVRWPAFAGGGSLSGDLSIS